MDITRHLAPIPRLTPYTGLIVDSVAWATAHDYHRRHHSLHLAALHGSGIASGLHVRATTPSSTTVTVEPGVAIDSYGNVVVVPRTEHVAVPIQLGTAYVSLEYAESVPRDSSPDRGQQGLVVEDFRIRVTDAPAGGQALELARLRLDGATSIRDAAEVLAPGAGELDLRFRQILGRLLQPSAAIRAVNATGTEPAGTHRTGFHYLVRESRRAGLTVALELDDAAAGPVALTELLYVFGDSGAAPPEGALTLLRDHVQRGGWALVDPCGKQTKFVDTVAEAIGVAPPVLADSGRDALTSYHVFSGPPPGGRSDGGLGWIGRCALSSFDYGCAWGGGGHLSRELIRSALEFGTNLMVAASAEPID